jgi:flagella basal body P-ring formation protein FlgA
MVLAQPVIATSQNYHRSAATKCRFGGWWWADPHSMRLLLAALITISAQINVSVDGAEAETRLVPLELRTEIDALAGAIRLSDIATPSHLPCETWTLLRAIVVDELAPGQSRVLTRDQIDELLRRRLPRDWKIFWSGGSAIHMRTRERTGEAESHFPVQVVNRLEAESAPRDRIDPRGRGEKRKDSGEDSVPMALVDERLRAPTAGIEQQLQAALAREQSQLARSGWSATIDMSATGGLDQSWQGIRRVSRLTPGSPLVPGEMIWRAEIIDRHGAVGERLVGVRVAELQKVLTLTRPLERGAIVGNADLTMSPVSDARLESEGMVDAAAAVGMQVKRSLPAGRPLRAADLALPVLVTRGELIELRVVSGGVTLRTAARALTEGALGDVIQTEAVQSKKRMMAVVTGKGEVQISPDGVSVMPPRRRQVDSMVTVDETSGQADPE